ncbi:UDP-glucosyltransferase 29 [Linum perenne]
MPTLKAAFDASAPGFESILRSLSPDLLIYDFLQPWAPQLAASLEIPAVEFICSSAIMSAFSIHFCNHGYNSRLVEELKIGVEVKRDGNGKVERGEMAEVIKEVLKGRNGGVRRNVKELSELIEKKGDAEIGEVVKELLKLCVKISVAG